MRLQASLREIMRLKKYLVALITALFSICVIWSINKFLIQVPQEEVIKVGFVYISDEATAYTNNFCRSQREIENIFGSKIQTIAKYNIPDTENKVKSAVSDLVNQDCKLIFSTSYGYGQFVKELAQHYPEVQFCQATCDNANQEPVISNYHTFMGRIFEGRYICGVVAGLKLLELLQAGKINSNNFEVGYVAAFPYPEVISGFTAFYLGVQSIIPGARMIVRYTETWGDYLAEKKCAQQLIDEGCVIIVQHSDTSGPAVACEEAFVKDKKIVYHVGYNQTMSDVAPTTSLISCRINWTPYLERAVSAVIDGKRIESVVKSKLKGNDSSFGFDKDWVEILGTNRIIVSPQMSKEIEKLKKQFKNGSITVFKGDFIGVNPFDENDVWNLNTPFYENKEQSAPSFNYILLDCIIVRE